MAYLQEVGMHVFVHVCVGIWVCMHVFVCPPPNVIWKLFSRISIIRTPIYHLSVKGVQVSKFARISELSDKIQYRTEGNFGGGNVGEFDELSVICQTKTIQISTYN